jgi:hypothetical protein
MRPAAPVIRIRIALSSVAHLLRTVRRSSFPSEPLPAQETGFGRVNLLLQRQAAPIGAERRAAAVASHPEIVQREHFR